MNKLYTILLIALTTISVNAGNTTVSGRQILVDGQPYLIKGICYNPVSKGSSTRSWQTLTRDLALMKEAGVNTIRVYSPISEEEVLNEIDEAGIKVIVGFGYNMNGYYDLASGSFIDYIKKYKNHNAILFWEFGNEYNYHPEWFDGNINNWYSALNNAAAEAHKEDSDHPVATAHGELPTDTVLNHCPNVDVWGMNIYRWDKPGNLFNDWARLSTLPMYLSEAGADSYMTVAKNAYAQGENEQAQADATYKILQSIFKNLTVCSGVTLFEFSDEWWKAGNPSVQNPGGWAPNSSGVPYDGTPNEEYWGIVDIERNKKKAFEVVKEKYNSIATGLK
ncbi:glycoside hydrolase family 2 TIM barrel-domain containing protein [Carboxylicivirga sp. RSCT41]|uniref:glycoside hydrolase family 2 TIM barrel-domain containing protein n=1 Tax=Carboxylicivirga agarovorans TaxID=3417570 RepID=UPI003D33AFEB